MKLCISSSYDNVIGRSLKIEFDRFVQSRRNAQTIKHSARYSTHCEEGVSYPSCVKIIKMKQASSGIKHGKNLARQMTQETKV